MIRVAFHTLRNRRSGFIGAFVALLFAATIITACGILIDSGARSTIPTERYSGTDLVVTGNRSVKTGDETAPLPASGQPRLSADAVAKIRQVRGVGTVTPERTFGISLSNSENIPVGGPETLGHGWGSALLTPMRLAQGTAPGADQVVLDTGLAKRAGAAVGDRVQIQVGTKPRTYTVAGLATPIRGKLERQAAVYFDDGQANALAGHVGSVEAIGVKLADGANAESVGKRIHSTVGGVTVYSNGERGLAEFSDAREVRDMLGGIGGSMGGITVMVAVFVVASTLALAVGQRHREVALLRATGATPRQIRRMIRGEAVLLALVAGAIGVILGVLSALWLRGELVEKGMMPANMRLTISWIPMAVAVGVGAIVAWLAAWTAARRAAKIRPTEALRESAPQPRRIGIIRTILGLLVLGGGIVLLTFASTASGDTAAGAALGVMMVLMVAVGLLGPVLAKFATLIATPFLRLFSPATGYLAAANTRANARRLAGATTPLILAIALAFVAVGVQTTVIHAAGQEAKDGLRADYVVTGAASGLPREFSERAARLPGVSVVTPVAHTDVQGKSSGVIGGQGVSGPEIERTLDLGVTAGTLANFTGSKVAVSRIAEPTLGAKIGKTVDLWLADGTKITPTVVALYDRGLGFGDVTLPRDVLVGHTPNEVDDTVLVRAAAGANHDAVRSWLEELAGEYTAVSVTDRHSFSAAQDKALRDNAWLNYLIFAVLIAFTVVAMVNTLVMTVLDRSRELALLRLVGGTVRQVRAMLRWESAVVIGTALVFGGAVAVATLVPFSAGITGGLPWLPWWFYPLLLNTAVVLAAASILLPAERLLTRRAADEIGARE